SIQSDSTKPWKPQSSSSTSRSRWVFFTAVRAVRVREKDLAQGPLVDRDVDDEAGILDAVERVVLGVRDHVALCTAHERDPHAAQVDGVLAVGLLRPPPARVAQDVHDRRKDHAAALRAGLGADRLADALLERLVPRRATRHADREAGRVSADGAHAARPVEHPDAGDAQARNPRDAACEARGEDADAVHLTELLGEGHAGEESTDATLDRRARV